MKKFPIEVEEIREINRITFKQSVLDLLNAFNVERGLLYTLKLLFVNPGKIVNLYLFEGRYKVVNAFRLLILTTAVSLFVMYIVGVDEFLMEFEKGFNKGIAEKEVEDSEFISGVMARVFFDWYNLFLWIGIPIYAFFTYLFFSKKNYNFAEHMVIQSFYISALNVLTIVVFPIYLILGQDAIINIALILSVAYFFYFSMKVFKVNNFVGVFRLLLLYIVNNLVYILALTFILGMFVGFELERAKG